MIDVGYPVLGGDLDLRPVPAQPEEELVNLVDNCVPLQFLPDPDRHL